MKTIVTAGKGGTGKSITLSHLLKRHILGNGFGRVLIVDADPHQSLTRYLGVQTHTNLGELRHEHTQALKTGQGLEEGSRQDFARKLAQEAITPLEGGDLLVMGKNDQPGCQCVVNTLLGNALDAVAEDYDLVVVDNEAGIEPIGRQNWKVDHLLLFSSPKGAELDVAWQILERAGEIERQIGTAYLLLNRTYSDQDLRAIYADPKTMVSGTAVLGALPYSEQLDREECPDEAWLTALDKAWSYVYQRVQGKKFTL